MRFVLASASPARLDTLRSAGLDPEVIVSGVDEEAIDADSPGQLAQLLAEAKLRAVLPRVDGPAFVLGCDSVLEFDGRAHGKPGTAEVATQRWRVMRGRTGLLHTGHALRGPTEVSLTLVSTTVHFADVTDDEIAAYIATGEPLAVAGGFTLDGLGGWFVERVDGDHHNVVGVSLPALRAMVRAQGFALADLGYPASRAE
jgi:septum formation protein